MPEIDKDELEAELDALGDDIALDEDTSYLDEITAPNATTKEPGTAQDRRARHQCHYPECGRQYKTASRLEAHNRSHW